MVQKQQIALFDYTAEVSKPRPKRKAAPVIQIPESAEISRLQDLVQRLEFCLLDTVVLASEYVEAAYWSKFLKRTNLNFEQHNLRKILLRNNDFVFVKGRPQREPETNP